MGNTFFGNTNAKGGAGGSASPTIQITKSYTVGYADVQPLTFNGLNSGISEHCLVNIYGSSNLISANGFTSSTGGAAGATSITDVVKYSPAGIFSIGRSIYFGAASTGMVRTVPFEDNGVVKYGLIGRSDGTYSAYDLGLIIQVRIKPFVMKNEGTEIGSNPYIKGTLRLLCWNTTTQEYETIEWTDVNNSSSSTSNMYKYNGYLYFTLANNYILCGILEATAVGYDPTHPAYTCHFLTEEDIPQE